MKISKSMLSKVCISAAFVLSVTSVSANIIISTGTPKPQEPPIRPQLTTNFVGCETQHTVQLIPYGTYNSKKFIDSDFSPFRSVGKTSN